MTENDSIISGCNVENAAYPQSQCAEASAIGNLVSRGYTKIKEVVVIGSGDYCVLRVVDVDSDYVNLHH